MTNFTDMEYGVIQTKRGVIIVINGEFSSPLNQHELRRLSKMLKEDKA